MLFVHNPKNPPILGASPLKLMEDLAKPVQNPHRTPSQLGTSGLLLLVEYHGELKVNPWAHKRIMTSPKRLKVTYPETPICLNYGVFLKSYQGSYYNVRCLP